MAPVIKALEFKSSAGIESIVVSTGQHREMMRPILEFFDIRPSEEFSLMQKCKSSNELFSRIIAEVDRVCVDYEPDVVLVHGDTTSAAAAAVAAFHRRIRVGHVEAGLRTGDIGQPFPEEMNRRLITSCTSVHFAPTRAAKERLIAEGISDDDVHLTGNTVIDALLSVAARLECDRAMRAALDQKFSFLDGAREILLVTGHRRENFGEGIKSICQAQQQLSQRPGLAIVYPVHLNPNVLGPVSAMLDGLSNVHLIAPADYVSFVYLMLRSSAVLTDSGGVQEEAPSLGKPVLVMRNVTERPEAVAAGMARLVGTDAQTIVDSVLVTLDRVRDGGSLPRGANPYGDGRAAQRIVDFLAYGRGSDLPDATDEVEDFGLGGMLAPHWTAVRERSFIPRELDTRV